MDRLLPLVSLAIGLVSSYIAVSNFYQSRQKEALKRHSDAETKEYAAQRDFQHLRKDYEGLAQSMVTLIREADERFDRVDLELREIKSLINVVLCHTAGDSVSGVLRRREDRETR